MIGVDSTLRPLGHMEQRNSSPKRAVDMIVQMLKASTDFFRHIRYDVVPRHSHMELGHVGVAQLSATVVKSRLVEKQFFPRASSGGRNEEVLGSLSVAARQHRKSTRWKFQKLGSGNWNCAWA